MITTLATLNQRPLVLRLHDPLSEMLEAWVEEGEAIAEKIARKGSYGISEQQEVLEHVRRLREEILCNPHHPDYDLIEPVLDNNDRVWEFGSETLYPSLLHYAAVYKILYPGEPLADPMTNDEIIWVRVHESAQKMLARSAFLRSQDRLLASSAPVLDQASALAYFRGYTATSNHALRTAKDEEFGRRIRQADKKIKQLEDLVKTGTEKVVACAKVALERHHEQVRTAQAITESAWETRFQTLGFQIAVANDALEACRDDLQKSQETCRRQSEEIAGLSDRCAALESKLHEMHGQLNSAGSGDCSVM